MKILWLAPLSLFVAACNKAEAAPAPAPQATETAPSLADRAKGLASKFNVDAVKATFTKLGESLQKIDDPATAEQAKGKLEQVVTTLKSYLGDERKLEDLGAKLGDGGKDLVKQVKAKIDELAAKPDVQKAIGPVLAELKALFGGA
jgi:hypothetical protein